MILTFLHTQLRTANRYPLVAIRLPLRDGEDVSVKRGHTLQHALICGIFYSFLPINTFICIDYREQLVYLPASLMLRYSTL